MKSQTKIFYILPRILLFAALFSFASWAAHSQPPLRHSITPKREVRAVWIATVNGLDWPKSQDPIEQRNSLRSMVAKLKSANFNTIFFQVRGRGDALYRSRYEPWSQVLTGVLGGDPGWDPLEFIIGEAHSRCMEVHAWFNTFIAKSGVGRTPPSDPQHAILEHPEYVHQVESDWWFDPGIPEVREYVLKVAMDIVRHYEIDGFHFDYIRYPDRPFGDEAAYRRYGSGFSKEEWRRENINKFVRAFHDSVQAVKPMLKIGSAPIGIYTNIQGARGLQSYSELFQDSRRWLREKLEDYLAPQIYWTLAASRREPDFAILARDWVANCFGRHVYLGLGAYKPEVMKEIQALIDTTRSSHAAGNSFFRYQSISTFLDTQVLYRYPANIPTMAWKDSVPPNPPRDFRVVNLNDGIFTIGWAAPYPAADGDAAKYFNVYRSTTQPVDTDNPANLIATTRGGIYQLSDTIVHAVSVKYFYAVTTLDKMNNESTPAVESVIVPEIAELSRKFMFEFRLGRNYPNPASSVLFVPYQVGEKSPVIMKILDRSNKEVLGVVDAIQQPGGYVAAVNISKLESGAYTCLMVAGKFSDRKTFTVKN